MIHVNKNGLKGLYIIAQGNALGLRTSQKLVREITYRKVELLSRTKEIISISKEILLFNSVREKQFALLIVFARTVCCDSFLPRALPWAEI